MLEDQPKDNEKKVNDLVFELARAKAKLNWGELERKQIESGLGNLRSMIRVLLGARSEGVLLFDMSGNLIGHNPQLIKIWQIPRYFLESGDDELAVSFIEKQLKNNRQLHNWRMKIQENPYSANRETLLLKNGESVELSVEQLEGEGQILGQMWLFSSPEANEPVAEKPQKATPEPAPPDAELRKLLKAKQQLLGEIGDLRQRINLLRNWHEIAKIAAEGMALSDAQNRWMYLNPAFLQRFGLDRKQKWSEKNWAESLPESVVHKINRDALPQIKRLGEWQGNIHLPGSNGKIRELAMRLRRLPDGAIAWAIQDVSEQKHLETVLQFTEERFRQLYDEMPSIQIMLDQKSAILSANIFGAEELGYRIDDILGKPFSQLADKQDGSKINHFLQKQLENTGETDRTEIRMLRNGAESFWVEATARVIRDRNGEARILLVCQDISNRKTAEQEINENRNRLNTLMESFPTGVCVVSLQKGILYCNESLMSMLDYSREELQRLNISELFGIEQRLKYTELIFNLQSNDSEELTRMKLISKNRVSIPVKVFTRAISYNGKPGLLAVFWDLRKESEAEEKLRQSIERYQKLVNTAPQGILMLDLNGQIDYCNQFTSVMLGYDEKLLVGKNMIHFIDKADQQRISKMFTGEFAPEILRDVRLTCNNDDILYVDIFTAVIDDKYGDPVGTQLILVDVTERWNEHHLLEAKSDDLADRLRRRQTMYKNRIEDMNAEVKRREITEKELNRYKEELQSLSAHLETTREEERKWIAREIHDEFGQQLSALKMDITWLEKRFPANAKILFEKTRSMSEIINITIKKVREISRKLRPSMLDNLGFTAAVAWQSKEFQQRSGIQFNVRIDDNIVIDEQRGSALFRVFQEALTNIFRHANATEIDVDIFIDGDDLFMTIRDNGIGIDQEHLKTPKTFGLIGMRERIHSLGGTVSIEGAPGEGTAVNVIVPIN
ncbi:MAG: PAS domain S-box protein [Calditrichae bacterium]|nr:PAS domain S-box protein [Calditrichia bacterium]